MLREGEVDVDMTHSPGVTSLMVPQDLIWPSNGQWIGLSGVEVWSGAGVEILTINLQPVVLGAGAATAGVFVWLF